MANLFGQQLNRMNIGNKNTTLSFIKRIIEFLLVFDQLSLCRTRPFGKYDCEWKAGWITAKTGHTKRNIKKKVNNTFLSNTYIMPIQKMRTFL